MWCNKNFATYCFKILIALNCSLVQSFLNLLTKEQLLLKNVKHTLHNIVSRCKFYFTIYFSSTYVQEFVISPKNFTEKEACENIALFNVTPSKNQVRLSFKISLKLLGNPFKTARTQFLSVERRLDRDVLLISMYIPFIGVYLLLSYMSFYKQPWVGSNFAIHITVCFGLRIHNKTSCRFS